MPPAADRGPGAVRIAVVAACLVLFALLAQQLLMAGPLTRFDLWSTQWMVQHRQQRLTQLMLLVSNAHETRNLLACTALVAGALLWRGHKRSAAALLVVPTGMLLNVGLKNTFQRVRPTFDEPLVQLATYSFPSGHAVASTVFYGVLCALVLAHGRQRAARAAAVATAVAMVLVVCFSRVYLGAHYPSDVTAGVAVGLAWLALALGLARPRPHPAPARPPAAAGPVR